MADSKKKRVRKTEDDYLAERRKRRQEAERKRGDAEAEVRREQGREHRAVKRGGNGLRGA
jgi:hypothetical protein